MCEGVDFASNEVWATWEPSRKRELDQLVLTGAAQSQPAGRALPSLFPRLASCPSDHVTMGLALDPFRMLLARAVSPALQHVSLLCAFEPDAVIYGRTRMLAHLRALSGRLAGQRSRWVACLPQHSPAARLNFPLMYFLTVHYAYVDKDFVHDLAVGMPIAGEIPVTGALRPRVRNAVVTVEQWRARLPARNKAILERVLASKTDPLREECWSKTIEEFQNGWITAPQVVSPAMAASVALTPRYAIQDANSKKVRVIDDFRASGINDTML